MDLGLDGLRALVGGASSGLGRAIATQLSDEGARVALAARAGPRLEDAAAATRGLAVPADLSTPDGPAGAVVTAVAALGGLDLLVINSGGPPSGTFADLDEATWAAAIDGVLHAALRLTRAALPHLQGSPAPAILIVLSSTVREPIPNLTTSNVLRPGLAGLVKTLSSEIAPIRINGIAPGRVSTDRIAQLDGQRAEATGRPIEEIRREQIARIPLGRYGDPAEIGRVGAFLLSPAASYVTGAIVSIDGGMIKSLP
jgi:3-oxoacyl-[acyl-carrier protein] reductase